MSRNPFHNAFTLTLFGSLLVVLGLVGCTLRKSPWTFVACTWSESVWWNEVGVGVGLLLVAIYFWRKAILSFR